MKTYGRASRGRNAVISAICVTATATATATALVAAAPAAAYAPAQRDALTETANALSSDMVQAEAAAGTARLASTSRSLKTITASGDFFDAVGDNEMLAPDLQEMAAFTEDDGYYTVAIRLNTNALVSGDFLATYVNTDGNPATGNLIFGGADLAVAVSGQTGTDSFGVLRWDGASFQPAYIPSIVSFSSGLTDKVWSAPAAELGISPGTTTTLVFGASYVSSYFDFAPEPGYGAFPFTTGASAVAPPPAPVVAAPVAPAPPATIVTGAVAAPTSPRFVVRSFSLAKRPSTVRARLSWVGGSGRTMWSLRLSTRIAGRHVTRTVRGAGASGNRTTTRTVPIPAAWKGRTVSARLVVENGARLVTRTRTIRL